MDKHFLHHARWVGWLLALLTLLALPTAAYAQEAGAVQVKLVIKDGSVDCLEGCDVFSSDGSWDYTISVSLGTVVDLTFVWGHVEYPNEEHLMVLEGYGLETEKMSFYEREGHMELIADKPGTFILKCDLHCELHDFIQTGHLKVRKAGEAAPTPVPAATPAGGDTTPTATPSAGGDTTPTATPPAQETPGPGGTIAEPTPPAAATPTATRAPVSPYRPTVLSVTPSSWALGDKPVRLEVLLKDLKDKPISKAEVRFSLDAEFAGRQKPMDLGMLKTDKDGKAVLVYTPTLDQRSHVITARFEGMGLYSESEEAIELQQVRSPQPAYVPPSGGLDLFWDWGPRVLTGATVAIWAVLAYILYQAIGVAWVRRKE